LKTEEEKDLKENSLSTTELDIEINFSSLEHSCVELFEETFLLEARIDLVKKPCEYVLAITQEDQKFLQIHEVEKRETKKNVLFGSILSTY